MILFVKAQSKKIGKVVCYFDLQDLIAKDIQSVIIDIFLPKTRQITEIF